MATTAALDATRTVDALPDLSLFVVPTYIDSHPVGIKIYDDAGRLLVSVVLTRKSAERVARELTG